MLILLMVNSANATEMIGSEVPFLSKVQDSGTCEAASMTRSFHVFPNPRQTQDICAARFFEEVSCRTYVLSR